MSLNSLGLKIYPATSLDEVERLRPVLEATVRDSETSAVMHDEIDEILGNVQQSRLPGYNPQRYYAIAETHGGTVLGMMGLQAPGERMGLYASTPSPIEVINAFVDPDARGRYVGSTLLRFLEVHARHTGSTEIVLNSGPRYRDSGWPFWTRMYGEPIATAQDYYGPGRHAPVWRKPL